MPSSTNKQTFTKVPPKRHAYRNKDKRDDATKLQGTQQRKNGSPSRKLCQQSSETGTEFSKKKSDNQLLYKIKYINPNMSSGNNQLAAKKKKSTMSKDLKTAVQTLGGSSRQRPPTAALRGKATTSHQTLSAHDDDQYRNGS